MSFDDAVGALNGAMEADFGGSEPAAPAAPVEQAPATPATPEGQMAPNVQPRNERGQFAPATPAEPAPATDTFDGGQFNPDTLAPELQDGWKQLQAAYTRKTQELASQRQQFDSLGDLNEVRQATELFRALQDPGYLQEFHGELTRALEAQGLTPAQARTEAARHIEEQTAPSQSVSETLARLKDDPELAPLVDHFATLESKSASLEQRLNAWEQVQQQEREAQALAAQQMAMAGEIQRQEIAVRQANPHYGDGDMDAIYELSAFFDGNLLQAQQRYEQIVNSRIEQYLAGKSAAATSATAPVHGTGTSEVPVPVTDLQEGYRAALAHLNEQGIDTVA